MSSAISFQEYSWNMVGTSMPMSKTCCSVSRKLPLAWSGMRTRPSTTHSSMRALTSANPGNPMVTSSMECLEKVATPFHDFWPKTLTLYPYSSNKLCGKPAVSTFNSWTMMVSYSPPRRISIKLSACARIELIFNVSIFMFAFLLLDCIIIPVQYKNNKDFLL